MNERTDQELLLGYAKHGSEQDFAALVSRHVDLVYSAAARMVVDPHLAQDVTQAVFTALARNARKLQGCASLPGWLHATARNQAIMMVRSEVRRRHREREAAGMNQNPIDTGPAWEEIEPELDDALGQLNENDRDVILLRFFQRKTAREISQRLRLSEEAAQKRISRALDRLRSVLARRGITSTAAALAGNLGVHAVVTAPAGLAASVVGPALTTGTGVNAAVSTGKVSQIIATIMTAKKWIAAGIATATGVALAPLVLKESPDKPEIRVQFQPSAPAAAQATAMAPDPALNWASIESTDYRQFIANLRVNGAPEQLIRDAVGLELYRSYLPRIHEIQGANRTQRPYWQKQPVAQLTGEQLKRMAEITREWRAVLVSLFGPEAKTQDALSVLFAQPDFDAIRLAWLPPDIEAKASTILEPILEDERTAGHRQGGWAETRALMERRLDALRSVLTPRQLEEYRFREDQHAQYVRNMTRHGDLTAEEFATLVKANDSSLFNPVLTSETQQAQELRFSKLLGPERGAALLKTADLTYGNAQEATERYGLTSDTPDRAWQLKRDALAEHARLLKDGTLTPEARQQRENQLLEKTRAAFTELLGKDGFQLIQQRDGLWLSSLRGR